MSAFHKAGFYHARFCVSFEDFGDQEGLAKFPILVLIWIDGVRIRAFTCCDFADYRSPVYALHSASITIISCAGNGRCSFFAACQSAVSQFS